MPSPLDVEMDETELQVSLTGESRTSAYGTLLAMSVAFMVYGILMVYEGSLDGTGKDDSVNWGLLAFSACLLVLVVLRPFVPVFFHSVWLDTVFKLAFTLAAVTGLVSAVYVDQPTELYTLDLVMGSLLILSSAVTVSYSVWGLVKA